MHTEQEAKQLWCPFARSLMDRGAGNRMEYGAPDDDPVDESACMDQYRAEMATAFPCLASGCAMWRHEMKLVPTKGRPPHEWPNEPTGRGWCGLAGRPE